MICKPCQAGNHANCKKQCDCQHRQKTETPIYNQLVAEKVLEETERIINNVS